MSRHTFSDGITADPRISHEVYDQHWPELGPSPKLIGSYYRKEVEWDEFEQRFNDYLGRATEVASRLIELALATDVEIVCVERAPDQCHRRLVAEYCARLMPELDVVIN